MSFFSTHIYSSVSCFYFLLLALETVPCLVFVTVSEPALVPVPVPVIVTAPPCASFLTARGSFSFNCARVRVSRSFFQ